MTNEGIQPGAVNRIPVIAVAARPEATNHKGPIEKPQTMPHRVPDKRPIGKQKITWKMLREFKTSPLQIIGHSIKEPCG